MAASSVSDSCFQAGIAPGVTLVAVNGRAYKPELLKQAVTANKDGKAPIELLLREGETCLLPAHGEPLELHAGRSTLRLRLAGHAVAAELPLAALPSAGRSRLLAAGDRQLGGAGDLRIVLVAHRADDQPRRPGRQRAARQAVEQRAHRHLAGHAMRLEQQRRDAELGQHGAFMPRVRPTTCSTIEASSWPGQRPPKPQ